MDEEKEKVFVYDYPLRKTQRFKVCLPNINGKILVVRKEIIRQQHNMGCTDGMKEGEVDINVEYEVTKEISQDEWQQAIKAVEKELKE